LEELKDFKQLKEREYIVTVVDKEINKLLDFLMIISKDQEILLQETNKILIKHIKIMVELLIRMRKRKAADVLRKEKMFSLLEDAMVVNLGYVKHASIFVVNVEPICALIAKVNVIHAFFFYAKVVHAHVKNQLIIKPISLHNNDSLINFSKP
jgi:hypothetical protein